MAGLKFRILLDSIDDKEVFRDILINDDYNFEHFYHTILDAFGLPNDQMASFFVSDEDWNKGEEIALMDMSFGADESEEAPIQMKDIPLKEKNTKVRQRFILVHDFLSMWIFLIELHEITTQEYEHPQLLMEVGEIPEDLIKQGPRSIEDMSFETEIDPDADDFDIDNFGDHLDSDNFDNIDDYDI
ncbi:hypothetical protein CW751_11585 [Brumimicrobium salinarum]|uniref:Plasmid pRiA4b Orf3-like domain-containing protein n=1 Tax=Brumimicrobium salinarum TaxID=2058658 RepID=A0A2I0R0P3_9FLAO|nr:hypothetical protein [Brumimicrobium salinarum]PKR80137.1 hypothetical protein CW751_11585 [Brumimicrobium salinarum]